VPEGRSDHLLAAEADEFRRLTQRCRCSAMVSVCLFCAHSRSPQFCCGPVICGRVERIRGCGCECLVAARGFLRRRLQLPRRRDMRRETCRGTREQRAVARSWFPPGITAFCTRAIHGFQDPSHRDETNRRGQRGRAR
jgi:hypothetical protein